MEIRVGKYYRTRNGETVLIVDIINTKDNRLYPVKGQILYLYSNGKNPNIIHDWTLDGLFTTNNEESRLDLIEELKLEDMEWLKL